jgi:hypothetical protein
VLQNSKSPGIVRGFFAARPSQTRRVQWVFPQLKLAPQTSVS